MWTAEVLTEKRWGENGFLLKKNAEFADMVSVLLAEGKFGIE